MKVNRKNRNDNNRNPKKGGANGPDSGREIIQSRPYHGPVQMDTGQRPFRSFRTTVSYQQFATSSAGGVLDFNFSTGGSTTGARALAVDFSAITAGWGQYFIASMSVTFIPNFKDANPGIIGGVPFIGRPWLTTKSMDSQSVSGTYANIFNIDTRKFFPLNKEWTRRVDCNRTQELTSIPVASDFTTGGFRNINLYADGLTPSSVFGIILVMWNIVVSDRE